MTTTLPNGTRVRITWPQSTHHDRRGVIESQVADKYRIEVDGGGGTFLRRTEFEVIRGSDTRDDS